MPSEGKSSHPQVTAEVGWITEERGNFSDWLKLKTKLNTRQLKLGEVNCTLNNLPNLTKNKKLAAEWKTRISFLQSHIDTWTNRTFLPCCWATLPLRFFSIYHQGKVCKGSVCKVTKLAISTRLWVLSSDHYSSLAFHFQTSFSSKSARRPHCLHKSGHLVPHSPLVLGQEVLVLLLATVYQITDDIFSSSASISISLSSAVFRSTQLS